MKSIITTLVSLLFASLVFGQNSFGEITGYLFESNDSDASPAPFAKVWVEDNGSKIGALTDENGKFRISAVPAGLYRLYGNYNGDSLEHYLTFEVVSNGIENIGRTYILKDVQEEDEFTLYAPPSDLINIDDIGEQRISALDIKNSPNIRQPALLIAGRNSEIKVSDNGDLMIRGARSGDMAYFIDGIKMRGMSGIPGAAIGGMTVYSSAIPAKYGDTAGGVIVMETKSYADLYRRWKIMTTRPD
jgi:hypothetical protein